MNNIVKGSIDFDKFIYIADSDARREMHDIVKNVSSDIDTSVNAKGKNKTSIRSDP